MNQGESPWATGGWEDQLLAALLLHENEIVNRPHIVVCTYPSALCAPSHVGPFATAEAARAEARRERARLDQELPELPVEVRIAPLFSDDDPGAHPAS